MQWHPWQSRMSKMCEVIAHCWERHPAKQYPTVNGCSVAAEMWTKLKLSGRQTIHISYCSRRHLFPSVYPSFNKPMSHATYFWGQVISHFTFVPRWAGRDTGAAGGEWLHFGVRSTGWPLFYDFLLGGIVAMSSMPILPPWQQHFQKHPGHIPFTGSGCWAQCLGVSNWIISSHCWGSSYTNLTKNDHLASSSLSTMNSQGRGSSTMFSGIWLSLYPTERSQGFWAIHRGARHIYVAEGSTRVWGSSAFLVHGRRFF